MQFQVESLVIIGYNKASMNCKLYRKKIFNWILVVLACFTIFSSGSSSARIGADEAGKTIGTEVESLFETDNIAVDMGSETAAPAALVDLVNRIVNISVYLGLVGLLGLFIAVALKMITSQGNPEKLNEARDIIVNAIIGFLMIAMASTILWILANLINIGDFVNQ